MASQTSAISSTYRRILQHPRMPPLLAYLLTHLLTWRTFAILFALLNLKSIPFSWHVRVFYLVFRHGRDIRKNTRFLHRATKAQETRPNKLHPIFLPVEIHTRTSLFETDYNLHKSNSTYFADLDHSRTALVASLFGPAIGQSSLSDREFQDKTGTNTKPGVLYPILGSVHTSFLREIKPLQAYTIRSRLLGWDRKWIIIASYFVRPMTDAERRKAKKEGKEVNGKGEILLACALNKYVLKQGRRTIEPGLALASSGWFNYRPLPGDVIAPDNTTSESAVIDGSEVNTPDQLPEPSNATVEAAETVRKVARRLSMGTESRHVTVTGGEESDAKRGSEVGGWDYEEDVEKERVRGLKIAERWLNLDNELRGEYDYEVGFC